MSLLQVSFDWCIGLFSCMYRSLFIRLCTVTHSYRDVEFVTHSYRDVEFVTHSYRAGSTGLCHRSLFIYVHVSFHVRTGLFSYVTGLFSYVYKSHFMCVQVSFYICTGFFLYCNIETLFFFRVYIVIQNIYIVIHCNIEHLYCNIEQYRC